LAIGEIGGWSVACAATATVESKSAIQNGAPRADE